MTISKTTTSSNKKSHTHALFLFLLEVSMGMVQDFAHPADFLTRISCCLINVFLSQSETICFFSLLLFSLYPSSLSPSFPLCSVWDDTTGSEYPFMVVRMERHCFSLTHQPNSFLTFLSIFFQLLSSSFLPSVIKPLSQGIGPAQVRPWGLTVYSLSPLLSFSLPLSTPKRALLIQASSASTSCSAATADNWTRHSQITPFSFSPTLSPLLSLPPPLHATLLWSSTGCNHLWIQC